VKGFNDRHGTSFTEEDIIRYERVKREIMNDDLMEMLRNNPPEVVHTAFAQAFFRVQSVCLKETVKCTIFF
jgi:type I restriction enzyme R subunit